MIRLNDDLVQVLGTPCFACASIAKLLIEAGIYEDKVKKAEYEQAVFTHWALRLYEEHGSSWREEGEKILKGYRDTLTNKE